MGGHASGPEDPDVGKPFRRPPPRFLLVVVDLTAGLRKMEIHGGADAVGELLGPDAGVLAAHVHALKPYPRDDLPLAFELGMEIPAVLQRVPGLGGHLLVQDAPAEHPSDPGFLGGLRDDVLGIIQIHERGRPSAHHLQASELGPYGEIPVGPVGIDPEGF